MEWDRAADDMVGLLRAEAGRQPGDPAVAALVEELASRSDAFADRWANQDVRFHRHGVASLRHPRVGRLTLAYEDLDLTMQPDQTILIFTAEPDSASEAALRALAAPGALQGGADRPRQPPADEGLRPLHRSVTVRRRHPHVAADHLGPE